MNEQYAFAFSFLCRARVHLKVASEPGLIELSDYYSPLSLGLL